MSDMITSKGAKARWRRERAPGESLKAWARDTARHDKGSSGTAARAWLKGKCQACYRQATA